MARIMMQLVLLLTLSLRSISHESGCSEFRHMRVKELRAYLAQRKVECRGCMEKDEYVSKAIETCQARTPVKQTSYQHKKPRAKKVKESALVVDPALKVWLTSQDGLSSTFLLFCTTAFFVWKLLAPVIRITSYRLFHQRKGQVCPITLERIHDPFIATCCNQVVERKAMATLAKKSNLLRARCLHDHEYERVVQCPLCRSVQDPVTVRALLGEYYMSATFDADYLLDSGIPDPAWQRGEAAHKNFLRCKTEKELREEMRQYQNESSSTQAGSSEDSEESESQMEYQNESSSTQIDSPENSEENESQMESPSAPQGIRSRRPTSQKKVPTEIAGLEIDEKLYVHDTWSTQSVGVVRSVAAGQDPRTEGAVGNYMCANCSAVCSRPKRCGLCKNVFYCSAACQRQHWSLHKRFCKVTGAAISPLGECICEPANVSASLNCQLQPNLHPAEDAVKKQVEAEEGVEFSAAEEPMYLQRAVDEAQIQAEDTEEDWKMW